MMTPFRTIEDYELFLYTLAERYPGVTRSTLSLVRRGSTLARVSGEILFEQSLRLVVRERIAYERRPLSISSYGYELWQGAEKLGWYDSQPHPEDDTLKESHPHHKHVPPDMKHHRLPAPRMSFDSPNLPLLIEEALELAKAS